MLQGPGPGRGSDLVGLGNRLIDATEKLARNLGNKPPAGGPQPGSDYVPLTVETFDNHVFFYADVDTDRCLDLIRRIREVDNELRRQTASRMLPPDYPPVPIWLHIQSNGGDVFAGFNLADQLQSITTPIFSIVEGLSASAATFISMSCTRRFITPSSFMLIHQVASWMFGRMTYQELKDEKYLLDRIMEKMRAFYSAKSRISDREIKAMLKKDSWYDAEECLKLGLVDSILPGTSDVFKDKDDRPQT